MRGAVEFPVDKSSKRGGEPIPPRRSSGQVERPASHRWVQRIFTAGLAASLAIGALVGIVAVAPEVYSPSIAAASNVYTETVSGATGSCSAGWFNNSSLVVPAGIISTQVTLIGGGGGGSSAGGNNTTGGAGGGAAQVNDTIPASSLPTGSVLYAHLGCGGGAGSTNPTGGSGGAGESNTGAGSSSPTGSGGSGATAQPANAANAGGGGGGGSALCVVAAAATDCNGGTIVGVAGGGGGAAGAVSRGGAPPAVTGATGGEGAATGTSAGGTGSSLGCTANGGSGACTGGGGGTGIAGAGGTGHVAGNAAVAGAGGSAVNAGGGGLNGRNAAGGGGGGGYFGGGGGAAGQSGTGTSSASGSGGGAASSFWNATYGTATFSNISTTAANCGQSNAQCTTSTTSNGSGGTARNTGASGSLVVKYTVGAVQTQSSFSTQPSAAATSGTAFTTQPVVSLGDYTGAHVVGDPVLLSIATHPAAGAGTLNCTLNPVTSVALGVASFGGCSIIGPVGAYTLSATDTNDGLVVATSSTITLSPGTPTKLAFTQNPTAAVAGAAISPAVTVAVEDAAGNVETGDHTTTVGLSITTNPGGGTLTGGFAVTVVAGVATFPGLSINKSGTGYILTASSTPIYTTAASSPFNITPGTANRLAFIQGPTTTAAGTAMTPAVTVAVEDTNGNIETSDSATKVTLTIGTNPGGGTLAGGSQVTVVAGVATFSGLSINKAGTGYTLTASSAPAYTGATSSTFNITPGAPTQLAFVQGPTDTVAGSAMTPAVTVAVEDTNGNIETSDSATKVTLTIGTNPGGGTLAGGSQVTVVAGVATFSGLSINKTGTGYTLSASSTPAFTTPTSSAFNITPGAPAKLTFIQNPTTTAAGSAIAPPVTVAVEDANGNIETGDGGTTVSLAIGTNPAGGTLSGGSAVTVIAGIATFSGISINIAGGGYTLTASSNPAYGSATSSTFNVTPGAANSLVFVQGPSTTVAGSTITPAVTVAVEDSSGNVETGDSATKVSLALGVNAGEGRSPVAQPSPWSQGSRRSRGFPSTKRALATP